jgi:hypothetical protein
VGAPPAENTLRSYATDLLDYLRFQAGQHPQPAAATINRRVGEETIDPFHFAAHRLPAEAGF